MKTVRPSAPGAARNAPLQRNTRAALLSGASAISLCFAALPASRALAQCAPTAQVISGNAGPDFGGSQVTTDGGSVSVTATGFVSYIAAGGGAGILSNGCGATSISNAGSIAAAIGITVSAGDTVASVTNTGGINANLGYTGIYNLGSIGTLGNSGVISDVAAGRMGTFNNSGTVQASVGTGPMAGAALLDVLNNTGTIGGVFVNVGTLTNGAAGRIDLISPGVLNGTSFGTLVNSGSITVGADFAGATVAAIANNPGGVINNPSASLYGAIVTSAGSAGSITNAGAVTSYKTGINNASGTIGSVLNSGTVSGTSAFGIDNTGGTIASLTNAAGGTIASNGTAIATQGGTIGQLTNNGLITGGSLAIATDSLTSITQLTNNGTITSTELANPAILQAGTLGTLLNAGTINGTYYGLDATGKIGSIVNAAGATLGLTRIYDPGAPAASVGSVTNSGTILGISNDATLGTVTNLAGGVISGADGGLTSTGSLTTVSNAGLMRGTFYGASISGTLGSLTNTGTIAGDLNNFGYGLGLSGSVGTITNSGTIAGDRGLSAAGATISRLDNSGVISASRDALSLQGITLSAITNTGTIIGGRMAVYEYGALKAIANSGLISGSVNAYQDALTITGGAGSTFGTLTNGTITVGGTSLTFAGGNTHLDQDVNISDGAGTVFNAGVLRLANTHAIAAAYDQQSTGTLDFQLGGTLAGSYGSLSILGAATFAGVLALDRLAGFSLASGQSFNVASFASETGDFTAMTLDGAACSAVIADQWNCGGWIVTEGFGTTQLTLSISGAANEVPEPAGLAVFATALAALGRLRRKPA